MNPRLFRYYSQELQHLRDVGGEFARDYPKVAGRLGLDGFECADPYVERLLEGFGFLAARVQMKIDDEFPRFTQHLSEIIYPHLLAPTPSMAVIQMQPELTNPAVQKGYLVPRGTAMRSVLGKSDNTACEYRTAHDVTLWPIDLVEARFFTYGGGGQNVPAGVKAGIRLRLRTTGNSFADLPLNALTVFLRGGDEFPSRLYECIVGAVEGVLVSSVAQPSSGQALLPKTSLRPLGFEDSHALLPVHRRSMRGYRLLQEYFAFPQRFHFFELSGIQAGLRQCHEKEVDVTIWLNRIDAQLEKMVDVSHFALHCTPAINLFPRRADRINLTGEQFEYHVLVDRTRPMDYEVFQIESVTGHGNGPDSQQRFRPFYMSRDMNFAQQNKAYYQARREKRVVSQRQQRDGPRSSYIGSETFISIVDAAQAPYRSDLRQLSLSVLSTNRDLPLSMPVGVGKTDFIIDSGAPVAVLRCIAGPSPPNPSNAEGSVAWRLINHLSLNYLSLVDADREQGATALREMLALYCQPSDSGARHQIEGVRSIASRAITRRLPSPGPITFGRGIEVTLTLDDAAFEGTGAFLLGAVLADFFAQYASVNSFTETVVRTVARGEIMRWKTKEGTCAIL